MEDRYSPFININTEEGRKTFFKAAEEYKRITGKEISLSQYTRRLYFEMTKAIRDDDDLYNRNRIVT